MPTPLLRDLIGSVITVTSANALPNNGYANSADKLVIDNATNLALLADFDLTGTFATAPVGGVIQLFAVDYSLDGATAGPTPASTMAARLIGSFSPQPQASNASTSWQMRLNAVPLTAKTDFYLFNNATACSLNSGWVLKAQCWSPGT